ncbi:molybdopterin converting factor subunit 1 [Microbulbifer rhizosphaerae]|uniref:Molybdopterin synthase sulfur carrier subunit n=1 Tax=Microbulbifer rhizosphaerae TaxID=1562603 RepID=A0A7W4WDR1_9GAMM|nr:molybdopterin synthase sulfur carrier subunit [Microbulbifer rhizosphaerae]
MIQVLFFARLRAELGTAEHRLHGFSGSVEEVRAQLCTLFPDWRAALQSADIQAAVNREIAASSTPVRDGDEVAFFPPVTGG